MQRYEKYKDSGIDWLGEIPEHWEVKKVKEVAKLYGRIGFRGYNTSDLVSKGQGAITISPSNIEDWEMKFHKNTYLSWDKYEESPEIQIFNDDILIVKTGSTVGKIGIVKSLEEKATINPQLLVVKNIKLNSDFLYSFLKTTFFYDLIKSNVIGSTIPTISESKIGSLLILQPPLQEQEAIITFLNDKCEKIDAAVGFKEQQIEKLIELRQITIHNAVTKGVPHSRGAAVQIKDSGIDWIGEIPAHWEIRRFGSFLQPYSKKNMADLTLLSITREQGVIIRDRDNQEENHNFIPDDLSGYKHVKVGQFAMNKMKAWQGSYGISKYQGIVSPAYYIFDVLIEINLDFFSWATRSKAYISFFGQASDGVRIGQWDLSIPRMKEIKFLFPPISEQEQIVVYLQEQTSKIDKAIAQKQEQIVKLKEYKQSLINEVVTGKLKVVD